MQRRYDHFVWVDDGVTIEEKRSLMTVERELRQMRSKFLTTSATLRICEEGEKFFRRQVEIASREEVLWIAMFMMTLVMYMVHMIVLVK